MQSSLRCCHVLFGVLQTARARILARTCWACEKLSSDLGLGSGTLVSSTIHWFVTTKTQYDLKSDDKRNSKSRFVHYAYTYPLCWWWLICQNKRMQRSRKMTKKPWHIVTHLRVLGEFYPMNTYQHDRVKMVFKRLWPLDEGSLSIRRVKLVLVKAHKNWPAGRTKSRAKSRGA